VSFFKPTSAPTLGSGREIDDSIVINVQKGRQKLFLALHLMV